MPDKNAIAQRVMANAKTCAKLGYDLSFIGITKDVEHLLVDVQDFKCKSFLIRKI